MSTTPKRAAKKVKEDSYTVTLTIAGQTFMGKGKTLVDAMLTLPRPEKMMARGDLHLTDGTRSNTISLYPKDLKRLFYNKSFLSVRVKSLAMGLR